MIIYWGWVYAAVAVIFILVFIKIVRPDEKASIERLGKYNRFANDGFNLVIPLLERIVYQDITERMMDVESFEAITKERLNTKIDLVVYYQVKDDEQSVKKSLYRVKNFEAQIVRLAQTTARNIIGKMNFDALNSERDTINTKLVAVLKKQSDAWGVEVVRVETKEITPPADVQESMNKVLKAENEKKAAVDTATAKETEADGLKRANIKEAEGIAQGRKIVADANAYKIKVENESARKYFKKEAQKLKQLEVTQNSLANNSKIILGADNRQILKLFDINR